MTFARRLAAHRTAFAILLAAALLLAQWSGLTHRVEHASLFSAHATAHAGSADADHVPETNHSCIALDGLAVADAIHLPPFVAPLLASIRVLALWTAFQSWNAPLVRHFSSRAPPCS